MSSMSGISGSSPMMQGMGAMKRPDPAKMAEELFNKLDSSGQGYIEKSDLKNAFDKSSSTTSSSPSNVDDLFSTLDGDQDGKVSKQEFSDALQKVAEQLDSQMMDKRLGRSSGGGMPPPPPPGGGPSLSKDELTSMASEIGSSDSAAASSLNDLVNNFDKADSDGDGKVSFKESQAYRQSTAASTSSSSNTSSTTTNSDANDVIMQQIMKLMQAYGIGATSSGSAEVSSMFSTISTSA
jgi:Ca2+-binding EF-hand superfamily protein